MVNIYSYVRPLLGKAMLLTSGVFIGFNNYGLYESAKNYLFAEKESPVSYTKISYLEQLLEVKHDR